MCKFEEAWEKFLEQKANADEAARSCGMTVLQFIIKSWQIENEGEEKKALEN